MTSADDDLLDERRHLQKVEAVAQETDDQHAERRAADAADAAGQARAADDDRRDRVELVADAGARLREVEARREDDARKSREQRAHSV